MKDKEQHLGFNSKSSRGLIAAGLVLLSGCTPPPEQLIKKINLGEVEITQLSPHAYELSTDLAWSFQRLPIFQRALLYLGERCTIEYVVGNRDSQDTAWRVVVVGEPNCVEELR